VPFGRIDGGAPELVVHVPVPAARGWVAAWESIDGGTPLRLAPIEADAGVQAVTLPVRDLSRVWTSLVNAAGVEGPRALVRDVTLTVRPTTGFGNPSLLEERPSFIEPLVLAQPVLAPLENASQADDMPVTVESRFTWRPEGTPLEPCGDSVRVIDRAAAQALRFSGFSLSNCDGTALLVQTGRAFERATSGLPFDFTAPFASWDVTRRLVLSAARSQQQANLITLGRDGWRNVPRSRDGGFAAGAYDARRDVHVVVTTRGDVFELSGDLRTDPVLLGRLTWSGPSAALPAPSAGAVLLWQAAPDGGPFETWLVDGRGLRMAGTMGRHLEPRSIPTLGVYALPRSDAGEALLLGPGGFAPLDGGIILAPLVSTGWDDEVGAALLVTIDGGWRLSLQGLAPADAGAAVEPFPTPRSPGFLSSALSGIGRGGAVVAMDPQATTLLEWTAAGWVASSATTAIPGALVGTTTETHAYLFIPDAGIWQRPLIGASGFTPWRSADEPLRPTAAVSTGNGLLVLSVAPPVTVFYPLDGGAAVRVTSVPPEAGVGTLAPLSEACLATRGSSPLLAFGSVTGTSVPFLREWRGTGWMRLAGMTVGIEAPSCSADLDRQTLLTFGGNSRRIASAVPDDPTLQEHRGISRRVPVWGPWGSPEGRTRHLFQYEPSTKRHLLWGGTTGGVQRFDGWSLETSTVTPGLVWRLPLEPLDVPATAVLSALEVRALAAGTSPVAPGCELVGWTAGAWRKPLTERATARSPQPMMQSLEARFTERELMDLDLRSLGVGVKTLGGAGDDEARLSADALELTLRYQLTE
jgi:hypothetical protein